MKRAIYIAMITGLFLLILEAFGIGPAYLAFVAFPIYFADQEKEGINKLFLHVTSAIFGTILGHIALLGGNLATSILLSVLITGIATYFGGKYLKAPMVFGTIGMIFATNGSSIAPVVMVLGMLLAIAAKGDFNE